jgi:hypothetical protein
MFLESLQYGETINEEGMQYTIDSIPCLFGQVRREERES